MSDYRTLTPADLDARIRALARERCKLLASMAGLLLAMKRSGWYLRLGFSSIADYAFDAASFSKRKTVELIEGPVAVSEATAGRAACDSTVVDGSKPAKIAHTIPPATRRFVLARDRARCVVPGCSNRDLVEVHHMRPRAHGGSHDPAGLVTLCDAHHDVVHAGLLRIDGRPPRLRFVRADGVVLERSGLFVRPVYASRSG
jgi:hypothetical protein